MPSKSRSSDIITHLQAYDKELKEHQNTFVSDIEKYLSLFEKLDSIKLSNEVVREKQKKMEVLQKDFDDLVRSNEMNKSKAIQEIKNIQQQEWDYIADKLSKNTDTNEIIAVLKSGVLDYKYAVNIIKNNNDIKQKIRDGQYVIARKGNRIALIATDKEIIGYQQELTKFLQQQDNKTISNVILSNVPVYNKGSYVLSFDKDQQDLSDDVLKIYFSVEGDNNNSWFRDSKRMQLYSDIAEDVSKQLIEHHQNYGLGNKMNVQIECSSDGIAPLLKGFLSAKQNDSKRQLSLGNGSISMSLIPREAFNGVKPETTAKNVYELFKIAIRERGNTENSSTAFLKLDIPHNDGRFEYHNVGSTDSFLKELGRLLTEHNDGRAENDKQVLLISVNANVSSVAPDNDNSPWFTQIKHKDMFTKIQKDEDIYDGIKVRIMNGTAHDIKNNVAGVNKNVKDGMPYSANNIANKNCGATTTITNDNIVKTM